MLFRSIHYQWRKGSTPLTNIFLYATTCSFTLYNVQTNITTTNGPGNYRVVVTNSATTGSGLASSLFGLTILTAKPPAVLTGNATDISGPSAILHGSVNANGSTTTVHFDYGLTTDYGMGTPAVTIGNGSNDVSFQASITNLQPTVTYHYRIVASNSGGMTIGLDQSFTTSEAGPSLAIHSDGVGGYFIRFTGQPGLAYRLLRAAKVTGP